MRAGLMQAEAVGLERRKSKGKGMVSEGFSRGGEEQTMSSKRDDTYVSTLKTFRVLFGCCGPPGLLLV